MRKLEHVNIVKLLYFFYSSGEKVGGFLWVTILKLPSNVSFITSGINLFSVTISLCINL